MKELIILITMFFSDPNTYPNAVEVNSRYGEPLLFATEQECANHIDENFETLKEFAITVYPKAITIKSIFCVEKEPAFTGV